MPEQHGRSGTILANEFDVSAYNNTLNLSGTNATSDVSAFSEDNKTYIPGGSDGSFNIAGNWNADAAADLELATNLGTSVVYTACPQGADTAGNAAWLWLPDVQDSYTITMPANDAVRVNHGGNCTTRMGGQLVYPLSAASNGNSASVDEGASTTFGGFGHLHVSAFSGTSITVTLEDSANDTTFATLGAFTAATGVGSERISFAGTVERYVRVNITGTYTSVTIAVAIGRNRK